MSDKNLGPNPDREESVTRVSSARKTLFLAILAVVSAGIYFWLVDEDEIIAYTDEAPVEEPQFVAEGKLAFVEPETQDTLAQIAIEIADDDAQRSQGLMYRSNMADTTGMLFIFDQPAPRSFWMKNTKISLDILYVDEALRIFMIYKGVMPYSEKSIPSEDDALYVLEVVAGFTTRNQIEEGDFIAFEIIP